MNCLLRKFVVFSFVVCLVGFVGVCFGLTFDEISGYETGQSRKGLTDIEKAIKDSLDSPAKLLEIEIAMGHFLGTDATDASKQFVCRQLGLIGTKASVGVLGQMLVKDETSDMARYALERIGGSEVDSVLLDGLGKTKGKAQVGIINSIGVRRMNSAVGALSKLASGSDTETSRAAINSLGQIGSVEAAKSLDGMIRKGGVLAEDSYLRCADQLAGDGKKKEARRIYKKVRRKSGDASIKVAAFRGLVHVSKDPSDLIISTIDSTDPDLQVQAISMVSMIKGSSDIKKAADKIGGLPVRGQVQLLAALSETGDAVILPVVLESVKSSELEVRVAAIQVLKLVGDSASVGVLAEIAANTKGEEQRTARASLYDLAATGTDEAILASFKGADAGVKIELLKAVVERKIANSKPVLSKGIQDRDAKVRMEALRAVNVTQNLQLVKLLEALTKAVTDSERLLAANTIVVVVNAKDNTTEDARQIVELMPYFKKKGGVDVTAAVLRVLGGIGNDVGYDTLVKAISSKNEKIQRAAIDGLSVWPDGKPAEVLMASVSNALNESNKVMAFRGLVAQLGKVKGNKSAHLYAEAMKIAPNDGEKRKVLSAMTVKPCTQTLDLGLVYIEDSKLKKEAVTAVSQILTNFTDPLNEKTLSALRKAKTMAGNDAISKRFLDLSGDDLSVWAKPLGKWEVVGKTIKSTENEKKLVAEEGTGIIYNGPDGKTNNLLSAEEHGDVTAHIEFMVPKGSNSGVYFMGRYEIQVLDSYGVEDKKLKHAHCGGIYQRWKDGKGFEGRRPDVNASKPAGQWQSFDVVFKAPRFNRRGRKQANARFVKVVHNGIVIHENQEVTGMTRSGMSEKEVPTGPLMLQGDHGPVAYRNIYLIKN